MFIKADTVINTTLDFRLDIFKGLFDEIFLTEKDKLRVKAKELGPRILDYLKLNKEATTVQISRNIGTSFEDTSFILRELEKEGLIKID